MTGRGTTSRVRIRAIEPPDGQWVEFNLVIVRGQNPGPVLYVGAGVHGDETDGVAIVARFLKLLKPDAIRGTVLVAPIQNPLTFRDQSRIPLGLLLRSPFDQTPFDMSS